MECIKPLADCALEYVKKNKLKTALVVLAMVLSYGFYVSTYTWNIDDSFTDFWNGGRLVAAGRFTGYVVQLFTGFMTYSPFFTMFLALCVFFVAGLVFSLILKASSGGKLSDNAVFVFWIVFVTYPLISEQMVYPIILLLAVGYLFTALSVYLTDCFFEKKSWSALITAVVMMILYIDFYEAFATVYLAFMMATVIVRFFYSEKEEDKKLLKVFFRMLKLVVVLGIAVVIRFVLSKCFLLAFYGTTKSGYSGNNSIYWFELGIIDCAIWLIRTVFLKYVWAAADYFPIFIFVLSVAVGGIVSLVYSVKKKSVIPVFAFILMTVGALSLNIVIGLATNYTMAQSLAVVVSFTAMILFVLLEKQKKSRIVAGICVALLVLNQAKTLNIWSVSNYERYTYEMSLVDDIGRDLIKNYPVEEKPVLFIGASNSPKLPEYLIEKHESGQPVVKALQNTFIKLSDKLIPQSYFEKTLGFYGFEGNSANDCFDYIKKTRNCSSSSISYLSWANGGKSWFSEYEDVGVSEKLYELFALHGYDLERCSHEEFDLFCDKYGEYPSYPQKGYITETDKYIIVNFGE